jgi:hypothetical protein
MGILFETKARKQQKWKADQSFFYTQAVLRIRDVYPGSQIQGQKESRIRIRILIKEFKYFNPKLVSKLSEI